MVQDGSASHAALAAAVLDCFVPLRKATEDPTGRNPGLKRYPFTLQCTKCPEPSSIRQHIEKNTSRSVLRHISVASYTHVCAEDSPCDRATSNSFMCISLVCVATRHVLQVDINLRTSAVAVTSNYARSAPFRWALSMTNNLQQPNHVLHASLHETELIPVAIWCGDLSLMVHGCHETWWKRYGSMMRCTGELYRRV